MNRSRVTGNLSSHGILFSDITNDRVGIGSTIPTQKLDVTGTVKATTFVGDGSSLTGIDATTIKHTDGNIKAQAIATGVNITGNLAINADSDNPAGNAATNYLSVGASQDLKLYHNGSQNYITAADGTLLIQADNIMLVSDDTAGRSLYQDNANSRLELGFDGTAAAYVSSSSVQFIKPVNITDDLTLTDTTADSAAGPEFKLFRNSASPADADYLGQIKFAGESDTGVERNYAKITGKILDASNGTEDGIIEFAHIKAGSQVITGRFRSDSLQLLNGTQLTVAGTTTLNSPVTINTSTDKQLILSGASSPYISFEESSTAKAYIQWNAAGHLELRNSEDDSTLYIKDALTFQQSVGGAQHTIWHSGNDGTGSGLDADLLDGVDSLSFLRSDADDTTSGRLTLSTNSDYALNITGSNGGKIVLQGANSPYIRFREGTNDKAYIQWDSSVNPGEFILVNQESSDYVRIGSGGSGLKYSYDGSHAQIWHSGNDGSGSGLDADTLDGVQGSSFLRSDAEDTTTSPLNINGGTANGANDATLYVTATNNNDWGLVVDKNSNGSTEYGVDIRVGSSANYGLRVLGGGGDVFRITGAGAVTAGGSNTVWHAGNDGSGSGLDADTLDGYNQSDSAGNNTIVRRNSSGYVFANYFNTTTDDTGGTSDVTRFYCSQDAYIRYIDKNSMRSCMNVSANSRAYGGREVSTSDQNYWIGSTGGGTTNFDTLWNYGSCFFDTWSNPSGQPSGTSHWTGIQAMHYNAGAKTSSYGFRIVAGAGQPALAYIGGQWGTGEYSFVKLWNADNDGSGSGLDADTVDGLSAASFVRADTSDTVTGAPWQLTNSGTSNWGFRLLNNTGTNNYVYFCHGTHGMHLRNDSAGTSQYLLEVYRSGSAYFKIRGGDCYTTLAGGMQITGTLSSARVHVAAHSDLRLTNGNWTGEYSCKIQHHSNYLYMQGGSNGHIFRRHTGANAWFITGDGHFQPGSNDAYDIGTSALRVRNLYTTDLQLSNESKKDRGGNDVDGSWGDWTLQEGEDKIFMINNRTGKKYSLIMKEEN